MSQTAIGEDNLQALPSVDDVKPSEEGGPIARSGFKYQDAIAVGFLIEMLESPSLVKVHCETHDDVVLVRTVEGSAIRISEFVQVKAFEADKLWSMADLCVRKKGKSSIFETSLERDKHAETSRFRLVTLRPVVSDLKMLTFPLGAPGREIDGDGFIALQLELDQRFPGLLSLKGNGTAFWLENCLWDQRHSYDSVHRDNVFRILMLGVKEGRQLLPEPAQGLLQELGDWAKAAGDARWEPNRDQKIITRDVLYEWWERRTREITEGTSIPSGGKLVEKMTDALLPKELTLLAIEMRRDYSANVRTPLYMEPAERHELQGRVKSEVMSLRASFVAGNLNLDGLGFHALCLDRLDRMNAERPIGHEDRSAFMKGCMYDIADRCLLRFARSAI